MKKYILPLLIMCLALSLLCGCTTYSAPTGSSMIMDPTGQGGNCSIDHNHKTVRYGGHTYSFEVADAGTKNPTVTILYPDGVTYRDNDQSSGYTGTLNAEKYAAGDVLVNIVRKFYTSKVVKPNVRCVIFSLLLAGYGIAAIADPEFVWMMGHMFRSHWYQSTDPTEEGLRMTRIRGVAAIIIGVVIFLMDWK